MVAFRRWRPSGRYCGEKKELPGPRDRTHRGFLVRENPWLQLQGCGLLSVRYAGYKRRNLAIGSRRQVYRSGLGQDDVAFLNNHEVSEQRSEGGPCYPVDGTN
jgi:hypothetical protein